ncbi:MAG: hypothetical protein JW915_11330 [Chitinispirillaceae bacterium]|nr:hypothetical protein [Chitinispirillaceae bacterium]
MKNKIQLKEPDTAKMHNIINMALQFSSMFRLFEPGSKTRFKEKLLSQFNEILSSNSKKQFNDIHSSFCEWGSQKIYLTKKKKDGVASYGQIAKTLNVVLKVTVHYCQLPESNQAMRLSKWLHAAIDTKMMKYIRPVGVAGWPISIAQVDKNSYEKIQEVVVSIIAREHMGNITPVEFDDIYWDALNR